MLADIVAKNNIQDAFRDIHVQLLLYAPSEKRTIRLFRAIDELPSHKTFKKQKKYTMRVVEDGRPLQKLYTEYPAEETTDKPVCGTLCKVQAKVIRAPIIKEPIIVQIT